MIKDSSIHLGYYDSTSAHIPNPGMGQVGYVYSDHQHCALTLDAWRWSETNDNNRSIDRII